MRLGPAEALPFPDARFDRVLSQFVLMFLDDQRRSIEEMAGCSCRVGTVAIAIWSAVEESPGYAAMVDLLWRTVGDDAADALLAPFSLGRAETVRELLAPTFADVAVNHHEGIARFASIEAWLHTDIRGWTLNDMIDNSTFAEILAEANHALADYTDDGRVSFAAPALIATAAKRN